MTGDEQKYRYLPKHVEKVLLLVLILFLYTAAWYSPSSFMQTGCITSCSSVLLANLFSFVSITIELFPISLCHVTDQPYDSPGGTAALNLAVSPYVTHVIISSSSLSYVYTTCDFELDMNSDIVPIQCSLINC